VRKFSFLTTTVLSLAFAAACGSKGGGAAAKKMKEFADEACKCTTQECITKLSNDMTKWMQDNAKSTATADEAKAITAESTRFGECVQKAMETAAKAPPAGDPPPADPAPAGSADPAGGGAAAGGADTAGYPQECKDYIAAFETLGKCDKLGPAKDSMKQGYDATVESWKTMATATDDATKKAWADGCKMGLDGLKQTAGAMGCTL
jgi:hypothetical protein